MIRILKQRLGRFTKNEDGSAAVEFVLYFTLLFFILASGVEMAYMNLRHAMLERAVDMTVRDIRLATGNIPSYNTLRNSVCDVAMIVDDCEANLRLEMIQVDPRGFTAMQPDADCVNEAQEPRPVRNFEHGQDNQLMLIRACMMFQPMFPTTGLAEQLHIDEDGYSRLIVTSAFVQEPR